MSEATDIRKGDVVSRKLGRQILVGTAIGGVWENGHGYAAVNVQWADGGRDWVNVRLLQCEAARQRWHAVEIARAREDFERKMDAVFVRQRQHLGHLLDILFRNPVVRA